MPEKRKEIFFVFLLKYINRTIKKIENKLTIMPLWVIGTRRRKREKNIKLELYGENKKAKRQNEKIN